MALTKLSDIYNALYAVTAFKDKVVYDHWNTDNLPALPWVAYRMTNSTNFAADNGVYKRANNATIELYTETKNPSLEDTLEGVLDGLGVYWEKEETYITDERLYEVSYSIGGVING